MEKQFGGAVRQMAETEGCISQGPEREEDREPGTCCIIPARGGSKRIPHKNMKQFLGKPMLAWTLEAASEARSLFSHIVLATDDPEAIKLAQNYDRIRICRLDPADASDSAGMVGAVLATIRQLGREPQSICVLPPTAPLRTASIVSAGMGFWATCGVRALMTASKYNLPPWQALYNCGGEWMPYWGRETLLKRSQEVPELVCDAGAMYIITTADLYRYRTFYVPGLALMFIPLELAADIDTYEHLVFGEMLGLAGTAVRERLPKSSFVEGA